MQETTIAAQWYLPMVYTPPQWLIRLSWLISNHLNSSLLRNGGCKLTKIKLGCVVDDISELRLVAI